MSPAEALTFFKAGQKTESHRASGRGLLLWPMAGFSGFHRTMDISRAEQRVLHLLAQGGWIAIEKDDDGRIRAAHCHTRDNWRYGEFDLDMFRKLKRKRAVASKGGAPYRITRRGLQLVRSRLDNR